MCYLVDGIPVLSYADLLFALPAIVATTSALIGQTETFGVLTDGGSIPLPFKFPIG